MRMMCTCQLLLSQMREIFVSILPEFPTTSEHCRRYSDDFQRLSSLWWGVKYDSPKTTAWEAKCRGAKSRRDLDRLLFRTQTRHKAPFIGIFSGKLN